MKQSVGSRVWIWSSSSPSTGRENTSELAELPYPGPRYSREGPGNRDCLQGVPLLLSYIIQGVPKYMSAQADIVP